MIIQNTRKRKYAALMNELNINALSKDPHYMLKENKLRRHSSSQKILFSGLS